MDLGERFWPLLGSWLGEEEQAASPWAPAASARAALQLKLDVQGSLVLQDYRQVRSDGVELCGHGVFQAGPDGQLRWWFFDSYGYPPEPASGRWDGGALVLEKTTERGVAEHVFSPAADALDYRVRLRLAGRTDWSPFLSGRYRRVSGH